MAALEFALDPRDLKKHGGPEWIPLDVDALNDLPWSVSGPWDRELVTATGGKGIAKLLTAGLVNKTADGVVALVWVARKMADVDTPPFAEFDILWRKVDRRATPQAVDADPPSSGSSEPLSEDAP